MNANQNKYSGVWPVMVTPFDRGGDIDLRCYEHLLEWYLDSGVNGIFALCGSSEMYCLNDSERVLLVKTTVCKCGGKIPVVATASLGDDIESHRRLASQLIDLGVDAIVLVPPNFCEGENQVEKYLMSMADLAKCDVGLYEMPLCQNNQLSIELVKKLAQTGRFSFIKETSCRLETIRTKIQVCSHSTIGVFQANIPNMLESAIYGAAGVMGITVNILPSTVVRVWNGDYESQEIREAHGILCLGDSLLRHGYPATAKYILKKIGFDMLIRTRVSDVGLSEDIRKLIDCGLDYILEHYDEGIGNTVFSA